MSLCSKAIIRLMDKILHDPKDPKLWELWYIPYNEWVMQDFVHKSRTSEALKPKPDPKINLHAHGSLYSLEGAITHGSLS